MIWNLGSKASLVSKQLFFCNTNKSNKGQLHVIKFYKTVFLIPPLLSAPLFCPSWMFILIAWDFPFGSLFPASFWCRCFLGYRCLEGPAPNPIVLRTKHPESFVGGHQLAERPGVMILFTHQPAAQCHSLCARLSTTTREPRPRPPAEMHGPVGPHCRSDRSVKEGIERFLPFQMKMKLTASWKGDFSDLAKMRVRASHGKVGRCQSIW